MKAAKNVAKDLGRVVFWYPFRWAVQALPLRAACALGALLGRGDMLLSGRRRVSRMRDNIAAGLNVDARRAQEILLANLRGHAMDMVEFLKYPQMTSEKCRNWVAWEGREHVDEALRSGRGVMLCTAHFGAKQAFQVALGHAGYRVNQINYHLEPDQLSFVGRRVAQRQRLRIEESIPCRFISARGFLRGAFRCLQENEILIVAADGVGLRELMDDSFRPLPFLGKTMRFPTNYVSLARRTGASLIPVFCVRDAWRHRVVFHSPLSGDDSAIVEQYVALLEQYVRRHPHLWEFWEEFVEGELLVR